MKAVIHANHGEVLTERGEGDSFFAAFGQASDAVAAAGEAQVRLQAEHWPEGAPVRVRMVIHTGDAGPDYRGPDVSRCARLRAIAHGGQVLLLATTASRVRVSFKPIDDHAARVTLTDRGRSVTGTLHIDDEGRLTNFSAQRYWTPITRSSNTTSNGCTSRRLYW